MLKLEEGMEVRLRNGHTKYIVEIDTEVSNEEDKVTIISLRSNWGYLAKAKNIIVSKTNKPLVDYLRGPNDVAKVIYNNPATIVFFGDGSKKVVKVKEGEVFDYTTGVLLCVMKKLMGEKKYNRSKKFLFEEMRNAQKDIINKAKREMGIK